jgi:rhodanese-related sulfurtransferase
MALTLAQMIADARAAVREVRPGEASEPTRDVIIDVREPHEYHDGHVPEAINIPRGMLELRADPASPVRDAILTADQSARILVYCAKAPGARSLLAAQTLARMGYERVEVLGGGLISWTEAGLPVEGEQPPASS